ncbi:MAG: hypothetical protein L7W43_09250, partial [Rubripirellula sp.]|nr:hypothetical protein [Rubripirellula sp.]
VIEYRPVASQGGGVHSERWSRREPAKPEQPRGQHKEAQQRSGEYLADHSNTPLSCYGHTNGGVSLRALRGVNDCHWG